MKEKIAFEQKKYLCPKHGEVVNLIESTIPGIEGLWCQLCTLEKLDEIGVNRLTPIEIEAKQ